MKRIFSLIIVLLTMLSTLPTAYGYLYNDPHDLQPQLESARNKTLIIEVYHKYPWSNAEWLSTATATLLNDGQVLTNYHVVGDPSTFKQYVIKSYDGKMYSAELVKSDKIKDLSLLQIHIDKEGFTLSNTEPYKGMEIMTVGHPIGLPQWSFSEGTILASGVQCITPTGELYKATQTDAEVKSGNSGGPLINDRGELMGIIRAKDNGHSYAVMLEDIKTFLSDY